MTLRPLVKYHGGKGRLHQWIISQFPPTHNTYLELFGGACSVLLNKPQSPIEIYNELEPMMFNLMNVLKTNFSEFYPLVSEVPYTKQTFLDYKVRWLSGKFTSDVEKAAVFYIVKRMSRGGLCERFSWSDRVYSTGPAEVHCWNTALKNLTGVHKRLQNVTISHKDGLDIIPKYVNDPETFMYLDPPYLTSTRVLKKAYDFEWTIKDHYKLATLLFNAQARVMVSGYESEEYSQWFAGWTKVVKDVANHSCQHNGKNKIRKQEILWLNYTPSTKE